MDFARVQIRMGIIPQCHVTQDYDRKNIVTSAIALTRGFGVKIFGLCCLPAQFGARKKSNQAQLYRINDKHFRKFGFEKFIAWVKSHLSGESEDALFIENKLRKALRIS